MGSVGGFAGFGHLGGGGAVFSAPPSLRLAGHRLGIRRRSGRDAAVLVEASKGIGHKGRRNHKGGREIRKEGTHEEV